MSAILTIEKLTKRFGGLTAVNNLNMKIFTGQINGLIGPNGSGKTTTLNLISGALNATSGRIIYDGKDITIISEHEIARIGIRRTFQNLKLFSSMTALENVMVGNQGNDKGIVKYLLNPARSNRIEAELVELAMKALSFVGLVTKAHQYVSDLPYGQQKLVEIARALIGKPKLLLLDEPATGLNPIERKALMSLLYKMKSSGITILIIEHNMDVIMNTSEFITVINFGTKICEGTPTHVQNDSEVISAYLGTQYKKKESNKVDNR